MLLVRFAASALVGVVLAVGVGVVTARPQIISTARAGEPIDLAGIDGAPIEFGLGPGDPAPIEPLPPTETIQLASFHSAASPAPDGGVTTPWWSPSVPRVPAVTQFDGGPLQAVNCVMASGAMLARLGYGIVTTGSQLRALQSDQDGATSYVNLGEAVGRGWGIRFFNGSLTPLQLRALLYAGAGAVVTGLYGSLPVSMRLQPDFTGSHAIYLDGFRPAGPDGPAAYYVMDPIGHTWEGYRGEWLAAEAIETFATDYGRGLIYTAWAFPGGSPPRNHPILPLDAYPPDRPGETPGADDPMPEGDVTVTAELGSGEPPGEVPPRRDFHFDAHIAELIEPGTLGCFADPVLAGCPRGIRGIVDIKGAPATAPPRSLDDIRFLYADLVAPGTYQLVIDAPPGSSTDLWYWIGDGSKLQAATMDSAILGGRPVSIATVTVDPALDFSFVASAKGDGIRTYSTIGKLDVGS
jgi:hypothetical protein